MQLMKKYVLSLIIIVAVVGYFVYSRNSGQTSGNQTDSLPINQATTTETAPATVPTTPVTKNKYKDGRYVGSDIKFLYGNMQVAAVITNGKIVDIEFLTYPNDNPNSTQINENAIPKWKQEVISSQQTKVNIVSRATDSGIAFTKSLDSALIQALNS